jgi:hypothetical protein
MTAPYREFVIEGPKGWVVGYLQGFVHGRDATAAIHDAEASHCEVSGVRERIRELVLRSSEIAHVLVSERHADLVRAGIVAAESTGRTIDLRLERTIVSAMFSFRFQSFSRECARRIRGYLDSLPDGVKMSADSSVEERLDPDAMGAESYAPAHDYELRGEGEILGEVGGVLQVHRVFEADELIDADHVVLVEG